MADLHFLSEDTIVGYRLVQALNLRSCRTTSCLPLPVLGPQM